MRDFAPPGPHQHLVLYAARGVWPGESGPPVDLSAPSPVVALAAGTAHWSRPREMRLPNMSMGCRDGCRLVFAMQATCDAVEGHIRLPKLLPREEEYSRLICFPPKRTKSIAAEYLLILTQYDYNLVRTPALKSQTLPALGAKIAAKIGVDCITVLLHQ